MNLLASVIIPTFEEWPILQKCLDCLTQQTVGLDRFEVIVANNNPLPDVPDFLTLPPNARVIHAPKPGSYAARNVGLQHAQTKALFFTDSDCLPDPRWIESGLSALEDLGPLGRIAGAVDLFPKGKTWTGPELYDRSQWLRQADYVKFGWCATANLVATRAAFDLVGPFSELKFSGGDREWGERATKAGCPQVFRPDVLIRHPARSEYTVLIKKARRKAGNRHQRELAKELPPRPILSYLLPRGREMQGIVGDARLSERQMMQLMWIHYRLGLTTMVELIRLRYFSARPSRS